MSPSSSIMSKNVSVFCREVGGEDCGHCLSLSETQNCGWCSKISVCTTLNQCGEHLNNKVQQEWFRGDTNQCNAIKEETLLGIFIGLAVIAFVIVILIIVNLIVLLKRTKIAKSQKKNFSSSTSSSTGIATLQKRLFGRKNSQEDPLPVVLLSYKADYDETLPIQVHQRYENNRDSAVYAIIDKKVSTPSSSFQGTMIFNHKLRRNTSTSSPLQRYQTLPHINRMSLIWNHSGGAEETDLSESSSLVENAYSPLPLPNLFCESESAVADNNTLMPLSCQTSLMQMSSNQYYLVVQINVQNHDHDKNQMIVPCCNADNAGEQFGLEHNSTSII